MSGGGYCLVRFSDEKLLNQALMATVMGSPDAAILVNSIEMHEALSMDIECLCGLLINEESLYADVFRHKETETVALTFDQLGIWAGAVLTLRYTLWLGSID